MSRILIGSSNVYRFYLPETFREFKTYSMVKCTNVETYKARMECIDPKEEKLVIISVIENFIADAVRKIQTDEGEVEAEKFDSTICNTIKDFFVVLKAAAERSPETKFAMVRPILRPALPWYMENYDTICEFFDIGINSLKMVNVTKLDCMSRMSQQFDEQGVHLTPPAGKVFVEAMLMMADAFDKAENVDLTREDVEMGSSEGASGSGSAGVPSKASKEIRTQGIENRVISLENEVRERRLVDNLMMARMREELDLVTNIKKEDRVIITGLTSNTPIPVNYDERKKWLRAIVDALLNRIEPGTSDRIVFVSQGRRMGRDIPMVEVKLDSRDRAFKIRNTFVTKKKGGEDFGRVHIANSVCLATRVRVDILRAIAKQFNVEGGEEMYISAYSSRPVLHINDKKGNQKPYALTFADAVTRYNGMIDGDLLGEAYRRAGGSFKGQLEQHFVVLKENGPPGGVGQGQEQKSQKRKRPLDVPQTRGQTGIARGRGRGKVWIGERGRGRGGSGISKNAKI